MSRFRRLRHLRRLAYRTVLSSRSYSPESKKAIVDGFHRRYYNEGVASQGTWKNTYWLGTPVCKCPRDLWVVQESLSENDAFFVDTDMEKFHLTFNPGGF